MCCVKNQISPASRAASEDSCWHCCWPPDVSCLRLELEGQRCVAGECRGGQHRIRSAAAALAQLPLLGPGVQRRTGCDLDSLELHLQEGMHVERQQLCGNGKQLAKWRSGNWSVVQAARGCHCSRVPAHLGTLRKVLLQSLGCQAQAASHHGIFSSGCFAIAIAIAATAAVTAAVGCVVCQVQHQEIGIGDSWQKGAWLHQAASNIHAQQTAAKLGAASLYGSFQKRLKLCRHSCDACSARNKALFCQQRRPWLYGPRWGAAWRLGSGGSGGGNGRRDGAPRLAALVTR